MKHSGRRVKEEAGVWLLWRKSKEFRGYEVRTCTGGEEGVIRCLKTEGGEETRGIVEGMS